jgi:putative methionine-R-sulfoxide reductase with GAF domain
VYTPAYILNRVISKNKGWKQLQNINNILHDVLSNIDYGGFYLNETAYMKYVPYITITSVKVKCLFSIHKNILSDNSQFHNNSFS